MILPLYTAILTLFFIYLSFCVIKNRRKKQVSLGDGQDSELQSAIRAHGNFAEYVPLTLLLIFFCEMQGLSFWFIHIISFILVISRFSHAYGVINKRMNLRVVGMVGTFLVMIASVLFLFLNTV